MLCSRLGTTWPLAAKAKKRQMATAAIAIATTELVIDRSTRPRPGRFTGGRATTFSMANWCSGSIAAIGPIWSLHPWTAFSGKGPIQNHMQARLERGDLPWPNAPA